MKNNNVEPAALGRVFADQDESAPVHFCQKGNGLRADRRDARGTLLDGLATRATPIGCEQLLKRSASPFCVNLLRGFQSNPEQITSEDRLQYMLEPADHSDGIEIIKKSQMSDAEELSLHIALTIGNHAGKLLFEALHHDSRIGIRWRINGSNGGSRRCRSEQLQSKHSDCGSRHFGHDFRVVNESVATGSDVASRSSRNVIKCSS
jgi:hypothetical protein